MNERDARRLEGLERRVEELGLWRNARESLVEGWRFVAENGLTHKLGVGDFWPEPALPAHLSAEARVPEDWAGLPVELELWLGGEGFVRLSTGASGGLNPFHKSFPVTEVAGGGETIGIDAEVVPRGPFGTTIAEPRLRRAALVVPETGARSLERDLALVVEACAQLGDHEAVPHLLDVVEEAPSPASPPAGPRAPTSPSRATCRRSPTRPTAVRGASRPRPATSSRCPKRRGGRCGGRARRARRGWRG